MTPPGAGAPGGSGPEGPGGPRARQLLVLAQLAAAHFEGSVLSGFALAAMAEQAIRSGEAIDCMRTLALVRRFRSGVERMRPESEARSLVASRLPEGMDAAHFLKAFDRLCPTDRQRLAIIAAQQAPLVHGMVVPPTAATDDYVDRVWGAVEEVLSPIEIPARDRDALFQVLVRHAPWDFRVEICVHDVRDAALLSQLRFLARDYLTRRIFDRIRTGPWLEGHPFQMMGIAIRVDDPLIQAQWAAALGEWPIEMIARAAFAEDDQDMDMTGQAEFERHVLRMVAPTDELYNLEDMSGTNVARDIAPDEAQAAREALLDRAMVVGDEHFVDDPLFAQLRDAVRLQLAAWVAEDRETRLKELATHQLCVVSVCFDLVLRRTGSRLLYNVIEYDILPELVGYEHPMREGGPPARSDPKAWTAFIGGMTFAAEATLAAIPRQNLSEIRATARRLVETYWTQLRILDEVVEAWLAEQRQVRPEASLPARLLAAFQKLGVAMYVRERAEQDNMRKLLHILLKRVVAFQLVLDPNGTPYEGIMHEALASGMGDEWLEPGEAGPQAEEIAIGAGMAKLLIPAVHHLFRQPAEYTVTFDPRPKGKRRSTMEALGSPRRRVRYVFDHLQGESRRQAARLLEIVDWLADQRVGSAARQAFNRSWTAHGHESERVRGFLHAVLWIHRIFGQAYHCRVDLARGIEGVRIERADTATPRIVVRMNGESRESIGPGLASLIALLKSQASIRLMDFAATRPYEVPVSHPPTIFVRITEALAATAAEWMPQVVAALAEGGIPYPGHAQILVTPAMQSPHGPLLTYVPPEGDARAGIEVDVPDVDAFAALVDGLRAQVPAAAASRWSIAGRVTAVLSIEDLAADQRLAEAGPLWYLTDGNDERYFGRAGAVQQVSRSELALVAESVGFDALLAGAAAEYGWPIFTPPERRQILGALAFVKLDLPMLAVLLDAEGWRERLKPIVTVRFLESRYVARFLHRTITGHEDHRPAVVHAAAFREFLDVDALATQLGDEMSAMAALGAAWQRFDTRLAEAEAALRSAARTETMVEDEDVAATVQWFAQNISDRDSSERIALYRQILPGLLRIEMLRRTVDERVVSPAAFLRPSELPRNQVATQLMTADELQWVIEGNEPGKQAARFNIKRRGLGMQDESDEVWKAVAECRQWLVYRFPRIHAMPDSEKIRIREVMIRAALADSKRLLVYLQYDQLDRALEMLGLLRAAVES
ncbi:MAG: hypothetical protein HY543_09820 [Deltaproteobacteria bacterium]|nr:hypothetical protein [Deltaproteobacteria bacterium]